MLSKSLLVLLIVEYFGLFVCCTGEKNFTMALYWLGAVALNYAVLRIAYP